MSSNQLPTRSWVSRTIKGKDIYTHLYNEDQKLFMISCLGHCMTPSEVAESFLEKYGIQLKNRSSTLTYYRTHPKWQRMINEIRVKYLSDVNAVAGAHQRVRLDRAERVYDRAVKSKDLHYQLAATEQQRKEFDKSEYNQINILQQQYINMSDEEVSQRKRWLFEKLKLVKEVSNGTSPVPSKEGS